MDRVVVDANILFSNTLRSFFLWLHWQEVLEIVWTRELWEEVFRNYSEDREKEKAFRHQMETKTFIKFASCMKTLSADFEPIGLPDVGDEHVVALARQEKANAVVTFNVKDFPQALLGKYGLARKNPDAYLCELIDRDCDSVMDTVLRHITANQVTRPKKKDYFESLARAGAPNFSKTLNERDTSGHSIPEVWS